MEASVKASVKLVAAGVAGLLGVALVRKRAKVVKRRVTHLVFDVDDTLYCRTTNFSHHRNEEVALEFMVTQLGFPDIETARELRYRYFRRTHSTMKALTVAAAEGALPPLPDGSPRGFDQSALAAYWAEHARISEYLTPDPRLIRVLRALKEETDLVLVIFSNGPRPYCLKVLEHLQVLEFFSPDRIFTVEDALPSCKPEPRAFLKILREVGADPSESVMFEDSMKNVRAAKALGMRTCLIVPASAKGPNEDERKTGDIPEASDPAVDVVMNTCGDIEDRLKCLWRGVWAPELC